ncbi:MAG TPA: hypothetical protein VFE98_06580 [Candidatus Bathyarchaeia archaeon]|nr:hypothetical protein [Candidatus Bathyarchaeia archaeon]
MSTIAEPLSFEKLVEDSAHDAVAKTLGETVWKAINFYFDPKQISRNPEPFMDVLKKLFGASSRILQHVITETLLRKVGDERSVRGPEERDFHHWIQLARSKFTSSLNPTRSR